MALSSCSASHQTRSSAMDSKPNNYAWSKRRFAVSAYVIRLQRLLARQMNEPSVVIKVSSGSRHKYHAYPFSHEFLLRLTQVSFIDDAGLGHPLRSHYRSLSRPSGHFVNGLVSQNSRFRTSNQGGGIPINSLRRIIRENKWT